MLNWIIGGTDAHAKNFSMLIGAAGRARLALLYDVASTLPYDFDPKKLKMATRIGGKYRLEDVYARHWATFASELRLPSAEILEMGISMADKIPAAFAWAIDKAGTLDHPIIARMTDALNARSEQCARILSAAPN